LHGGNNDKKYLWATILFCDYFVDNKKTAKNIAKNIAVLLQEFVRKKRFFYKKKFENTVKSCSLRLA